MWGWLPPLRQTAHEPPFSTQLWTPPTPPQDDSDVYIDPVVCLTYEATPIPESKLPPVYVRRERRRHKTDPSAVGRKKKQRHGEVVVPPRSLFDRATPGLLKMRREGKEQKKNILLKQQTQFAKPLPTFAKPATESGPDNPEWLVSEDWALLQVSTWRPRQGLGPAGCLPHATSPSFGPLWSHDPDSAHRADLAPTLVP